MAAKKQVNKVNTATLLRGRVYVFENVHFQRGVPTIVGPDLAMKLEDLYDEVQDSDSDTFEKPYFLVEMDVDPPSDEDEYEDDDEYEEEERRPRRKLRKVARKTRRATAPKEEVRPRRRRRRAS